MKEFHHVYDEVVKQAQTREELVDQGENLQESGEIPQLSIRVVESVDSADYKELNEVCSGNILTIKEEPELVMGS